MNKKVNDLNRKTVSETNFYGLLCSLKGGLAGLPPTRKKGVLAPSPKELFWDIDGNVHTCITKTTPNDPKNFQQYNKPKQKKICNK